MGRAILTAVGLVGVADAPSWEGWGEVGPISRAPQTLLTSPGLPRPSSGRPWEADSRWRGAPRWRP
eukprot:13325215-Heterocapsa_arctica.AAC.1